MLTKSFFYVACVDFSDEFSGISRKVFSQYKAMCYRLNGELLGFWGNDLALFSGEDKRIIRGTGNRRRRLFRFLSNYLKGHRFDCFYFRRTSCTYIVINCLRKIKKPNTKILWEIPTYPYDSERVYRPQEAVYRFFDKFYRRFLRKYVDRIVTFSREDSIFGISTIRTFNGIDMDRIRMARFVEHEGINLIAVAVIRAWHGYDRIIEGLHNYYDTKPERKVFFHLVGDGPDLKEYKELIRMYNLEDYVILYGFKNAAEIDDIYDYADIAVESLGWHRSNVTVGTSLKVREYLAKGLPILASTPIDIFPEGSPYVLSVPIDDSPINIGDVLCFYDDLVGFQSKVSLAHRIREIAQTKCDMRVTMKPVTDFFLKALP